MFGKLIAHLRGRKPTLPGLSERESADYLLLDWMLSVGLCDPCLARRHTELATTLDAYLKSTSAAAEPLSRA